MAYIETDVLIVGAGPAGLTAALALSTYGVRVLVVTKHRWLSPTPRAHVTNQRTFEILRDLGVEAEAKAQATPYSLLPDIVLCTSLAGEELARMRVLGSGVPSDASPCGLADLAQNLLEPILLQAALGRGAEIRFNTEYLRCAQDAEGVTAALLDRGAGEEFTVRARYMIGADGGRSRVAEEMRLPMEGDMDLAGSLNIWFEADLSRYTAHRPAFLYFLVRTDRDPGGAGLASLRPTRRWNEWLFTTSPSLGEASPTLTHNEAAAVLRDQLGLPGFQPILKKIDPWSLNAMRATRYAESRVFCMGDAVHRHVPANGLGSNTGVGDAYNLAWKLAFVLQGQAEPSLLDSYDAERVPVGKQVVERATKSLWDYPPVLTALGATGDGSTEKLKAATPGGVAQREALRAAMAAKEYDFGARGVELNHRYASTAVVGDGTEPRPYPLDPELHPMPTTCPGARLPHAWVQRDGLPLSTLDLVGKGRFTVLTGIGGEVWTAAAAAASASFGIPVEVCAIGPGCAYTDLYRDWTALRETAESGCLLVRPDGHVAWRAHMAPAAGEAQGALLRALGQVLGRASRSGERKQSETYAGVGK